MVYCGLEDSGANHEDTSAFFTVSVHVPTWVYTIMVTAAPIILSSLILRAKIGRKARRGGEVHIEETLQYETGEDIAKLPSSEETLLLHERDAEMSRLPSPEEDQLVREPGERTSTAKEAGASAEARAQTALE